MGRKRIIKIPKSVKIKCPHCGKKNLIKMPKENIYFFECKKCKNKIETPQSQCCILCAYSNSRCYNELIRTAQRNELEVRQIK
ncbi:MAG: GDCCVxC domain-containing (seleno)protein [Candidatus Pacearchaeota archaeon]